MTQNGAEKPRLFAPSLIFINKEIIFLKKDPIFSGLTLDELCFIVYNKFILLIY